MTEKTERAVLAGGCFWGMQDLIRKMTGVLSTRVGYSGGNVANATYENHGTHADQQGYSYRTNGWPNTPLPEKLVRTRKLSPSGV